MFGWLKSRSVPVFRHKHPTRSEQSAKFMKLVEEMDKHTLMHCIVVAVSDRPDMNDADRAVLVLRINSQIRLSETVRPERR